MSVVSPGEKADIGLRVRGAATPAPFAGFQSDEKPEKPKAPAPNPLIPKPGAPGVPNVLPFNDAPG